MVLADIRAYVVDLVIGRLKNITKEIINVMTIALLGLREKVSKATECVKGLVSMSKRELIDCIKEINKTAKAQFLAMFSEKELADYLEHLMELDLKELVTC